jgi:hypothetical protein
MMDPAEFRRLLHNGRGQALLYLQDHDAAPHREAILYACLHNTVYDRQAEGSNAEYIFEAIGLANEAAFYRDALLRALQHPMDEYHLGQICDLLRCFAQQGDQGARQALYDAFSQEQADYEAMFAIVELDGLPGFLHIADRIGASAAEDEDFWEGHSFLLQLIERYGEGTVREALAAAGAVNPRVAAYVAAVENEEARYRSRRYRSRAKASRNPGEIDYAHLKSLFDSPDKPSPLWMRRWGKQASDADLRQLASDLVVETNHFKRRMLLSAFAKRAFPLNHAVLIRLVDDDDEHVAFAAVRALAAVTHPDLRAYALTLLSSERSWIGLKVLVNHYRVGDHLLVEDVLKTQYGHSSEENHRIELDAIALFEHHPSTEATTSLLLIYEYTHCTYCRKDCAFLLHQLRTLPEAVRQECEYDAYPRLRAAARSYFAEEGDSSAL